MLIKQGTGHFSSVQQIRGQDHFHNASKNHIWLPIYSSIEARLELRCCECALNKVVSAACYCARSNPTRLQFRKDSGSSFRRMLWVTGAWAVQLFSPEAHITCWNKLLCNYLIISLSLLPFKKKPLQFNLEQTQLIQFYDLELKQRQVRDSKPRLLRQYHRSKRHRY